MRPNTIINRIPIIHLFLFLFLIILYFSDIAQSRIIWQIGNEDKRCEEFLSCEGFISPENRVIDYQVPLDWESRLGQENHHWEGFPSCLYPYNNESKNPQEIRINFHYPKDFNYPVLRIKASASQRSASQYLEVYKGPEAEGGILIGKKPVNLPYYVSYDFTLGEIKKGAQEKNRIILRNIPGNPLSNILPIVFDALYLDDNDKDGDGVSDPDEGDADWDQDGLPDKLDPDVVCIPIKTDDKSVVKRICMNIKEPEGEAPFFREVRFLDTNSLNLPDWLGVDRYLPYGILGFKIEGVRPEEEILLEINYRDKLYPSMRLYVYQDPNNWRELAYGHFDSKGVTITLKDGEAGDLDGKKDGSVNTFLALSYPSSLGIEIREKGCFLKGVIGEP